MRFYSYLFLLIFIMNGCVDDKDENENENTDGDNTLVINDYINTQSSLYNLSLEKTQWAITYNESFYIENSINDDAHIHGDYIYSKYTGKGVKVAIIDNGFDINHPEFQDRVIAKINTSSYGNSTDISHSLSSEYHGTAVAGIIGASDNSIGTRGIASGSELILVKMAEWSTDLETIEMFEKTVQAGADIINCSWGTYDVSDSVKEYIDDIATNGRDGKGVIIIFASGNENKDMGNDESAIDSVIGVGATDHQTLRTSYSNYGVDLDIVAPGGSDEVILGITTLDPLGRDGSNYTEYITYDQYNRGTPSPFIGTSAAAPIATGALALVLEANPNITRVELQNLLKTTSDKIGMNLPYIINIEVTNETMPQFSGILGSQNNDEFELRIIDKYGYLQGRYSINVDGNNWNAQVDVALSEGFYSAELYSPQYNSVLATIKQFEVNTGKFPISHGMKNDFYGYGKINLQNLIDNLTNIN